MEEPFVSRGFKGKRRKEGFEDRTPPGQHIVDDFPVLSAGPTPKIDLSKWEMKLEGLVENPISYSWKEFLALPAENFKNDIHCVTTWSKLDTKWRGVSIDTLLEGVSLLAEAQFVMVFCYGGYTTNLPIKDLTDGKAFIAYQYDGFPLTPEHGGPARLVVPHLYFWKSAKWIQGLHFMKEDKAGFWEELGYHMYGDPWEEQRYG